jgi:hypothetical protein
VLSTTRCRALLGPDCVLSEAKLERLREDLYALAGVALENLSCHKALLVTGTRNEPNQLLGASAAEPPPRTISASLDEEYEPGERAAILEFDAGMCRAEAEDKADLRSTNHLSNSIKPRT